MPTTYCQKCERLVAFSVEGATPISSLNPPAPPAVTVHVEMACGHSKGIVTIPPVEEVVAA